MFGDYNLRRSFELTAIYLTPSYIKDFFDCRFFEKISGQFFQKEFEKIINRREKSRETRNDILDILIKIKNEEKNLGKSTLLKKFFIPICFLN